MNRFLMLSWLLCSTAATAAAQPNTLTQAERAGGWRLLFDGTTLNGWRGLGLDSIPSAHWRVADGAIMKVANKNVVKLADGKTPAGADVVSVDSFQNFELSWEWKVTTGANSGVKYNVSEEFAARNNSPHSALGWEFQLQDDSLGEDINVPSHRSGSLYEMIASTITHPTKPVGEWNTARLVFNKNKGEHWLNGRKVLAFDVTAPGFAVLLQHSKYHTIPGFAERRTGHIVLQDHGDEVYFRSIKVRLIR